MSETRWFAAGAGLLALAIILGAFGAHGLKDLLSDYQKAVYEKAVFYHAANGLGLLIVACAVRLQLLPASAGKWICILLVTGIFLFSGSLYLLAVTGKRWLGAITPLGGSAFIVAWLMAAWSAFKPR